MHPVKKRKKHRERGPRVPSAIELNFKNRRIQVSREIVAAREQLCALVIEAIEVDHLLAAFTPPAS